MSRLLLKAKFSRCKISFGQCRRSFKAASRRIRNSSSRCQRAKGFLRMTKTTPWTQTRPPNFSMEDTSWQA